jgi:YggT family protein
LNGWLIAVCTVVDLIAQPCNILFYALLIRVILSWVSPHLQHPLSSLLFMITEPMLKWIRGYIPPIAGLDFSTLVIMILLKVITLFVTASLPFPLV